MIPSQNSDYLEMVQSQDGKKDLTFPTLYEGDAIYVVNYQVRHQNPSYPFFPLQCGYDAESPFEIAYTGTINYSLTCSLLIAATYITYIL